jgi:nicotinamide-nucleotide amidase
MRIVGTFSRAKLNQSQSPTANWRLVLPYWCGAKPSKLTGMANTDIELARLAARVGRHLRNSQWTVAAAESCTGGWISKALTDIAGSSDWFLEGFVTYSNDAKVRRLGVPRALLQRKGAVSEATVRAMVRGVLRRSDAQVAVAVTGIAGPGGASPGKPVGTVWLGWATRRGRGIRVTVELKHFRGNREAVRRKTVRAALEGLLAS